MKVIGSAILCSAVIASAANISIPVHIYVDAPIATTYGTNTPTLVQGQLNTIATKLSEATGDTYTLSMASYSTYSGSWSAHFGHQPNGLGITYASSGLNAITESADAAVLAWSTGSFGGPFAATATQSLTKIVGLLRGSIDLARTEISATNNAINGTALTAPASIANNPFNATTWDPQSAAIIKYYGGNLFVSQKDIPQLLADSIEVKVVDKNGVTIPSAQVRLYPIGWPSPTLDNSPVSETTTGSQGTTTVDKGIFNSGTNLGMRGLRNVGFLVEARANNTNGYATFRATDVAYPVVTSGTMLYKQTVSIPIDASPATDLGAANSGTTHVFANLNSNLAITKFPTWNYRTIKISFTAISEQLGQATVRINGQVVGTLSGWYKTLVVDQSGNQPLSITIESSNPQHFNVNWWVES